MYTHIHPYTYIDMLETTGLVWERFVVGDSYKLSILFNAIASTLIQFTNIICTNDYNTFFHCLLMLLAIKPVTSLKLEHVFCLHLYT